jgi:AraC family transcriptional regulator
MCLIPALPPQPSDGDKAAACFTFYLAPRLLLAAISDVRCGATGVLVWVRQAGHAECVTPAVRPVLIVRLAYEALQGDYVELVPHLPTCDPLRQHIALVLQARSKADDLAGQLYAESLANALAVHLLRRYAAGAQPRQETPASLSPSKLRRVTAYVQEHLEHELPLATLAAVAQTSPAHFSRLFKQATGQTPHQYVIMCRIEHARQLLAETDLPLSEICQQVGCADQSHFTALFRKHVATTPKGYRDEAQR